MLWLWGWFSCSGSRCWTAYKLWCVYKGKVRVMSVCWSNLSPVMVAQMLLKSTWDIPARSGRPNFQEKNQDRDLDGWEPAQKSQDKLLALVINYALVKETKTHGTFNFFLLWFLFYFVKLYPKLDIYPPLHWNLKWRYERIQDTKNLSYYKTFYYWCNKCFFRPLNRWNFLGLLLEPLCRRTNFHYFL